MFVFSVFFQVSIDIPDLAWYVRGGKAETLQHRPGNHGDVKDQSSADMVQEDSGGLQGCEHHWHDHFMEKRTGLLCYDTQVQTRSHVSPIPHAHLCYHRSVNATYM